VNLRSHLKKLEGVPFQVLTMNDYTEPFHNFINSHDPLVSVVIPSYNKAPYLTECVESYVVQTYKNIEVLIVNDGSPDDTSEVARQLIAKYPHVTIQLLEKPNGGVSDASNFGLRQTKGRVVMTMDGDDMAKPHYIETAIKTLRQTGGDIFSPSQENFGIDPGQWVPQEYDRYFIRYDNCFPTPSIYDKLLFEKTGGFKVYLGYAEDWEYWTSCSRHNPKVTQSKECLTCYRTNETGIAATFIDGKWDDCVSVVAIANEDLYSVDEVLSAHIRVPKSAEANIQRMKELDLIHPNEWFLKFFLALVAESEGRPVDAMQLLTEAVELDDTHNWQPMYRLALLYQRERAYEPARQLFHAVRALRPDMKKYVEDCLDEISEAVTGQKKQS